MKKYELEGEIRKFNLENFLIRIMKKRLFTLLALLVLLPVMAFATEVVITWEWMLDDPQVTSFRYQLNGEDPDSWVIVDGMTSSCAIENLDGTKEHSLYLQQTYDGVNWSPSAISTAQPLIVAEEPVVEVEEVEEIEAIEEVEAVEEVAEAVEEETVEVIEEEVAEVVEEETTEAVEKVQEEVVVAKAEKTKKPYYTSVSLKGSGIYTPTPVVANTNYDELSAAAGVALGFNNIATLGNVGLGLNVDVDAMLVPKAGQAKASLKSFFLDTSITDYSLRLTLAPKAEMELGRFIFNVGGLVDASLVGINTVGTLDVPADLFGKVLIGYGGQAGIAFKINDLIQIGADAKFRRFAGLNGEWGVEVTPALRFAF